MLCRAWQDITTLGGNYLTPLLYLNKDARTPLQIRKSLTFVSAENSPRGCSGFRSESDQLPSSRALLRHHSGLVTNWSTFYKDIEFPTPCVAEYHVPLFAGLAGGRFANLLIIFRSRKDKLSVLIYSPSAVLYELIVAGEGPVLADTVKEISDSAC